MERFSGLGLRVLVPCFWLFLVMRTPRGFWVAGFLGLPFLGPAFVFLSCFLLLLLLWGPARVFLHACVVPACRTLAQGRSGAAAQLVCLLSLPGSAFFPPLSPSLSLFLFLSLCLSLSLSIASELVRPLARARKVLNCAWEGRPQWKTLLEACSAFEVHFFRLTWV